MENSRNIKRSELFYSILEIVRQLPIDSNGMDAPDYNSVSSDLEVFFQKKQLLIEAKSTIALISGKSYELKETVNSVDEKIKKSGGVWVLLNIIREDKTVKETRFRISSIAYFN